MAFIDKVKEQQEKNKKPFVIDKTNNDIEFDANNLPPFEAKNGVVKYYFTELQYENMILISGNYNQLKDDLMEAKKELKAAHAKIDALTDKLMKVVDASYLTTAQFNRIEFEKVKSSTK